MIRLVALIAALSLTASLNAQALPTRTQSFDSDPHWTGRNNRARPKQLQKVNQNFGYDAKRKQIGGEFWQTLRPMWYATPVGAKSFEDSYSASGRVYIVESGSGSGWQNTCNIFVGWFDADERSVIWRPKDFVGFRFQSTHDPDGALAEITYGTSKWQADGAFVNKLGGGQKKLVRELTEDDLLKVVPDGKPHEWSLKYQPHPTDGTGEIIFTFDGVESRLDVNKYARKAGAKMSHFGFFAPRIPGRRMIVYFDDLTIDGKKVDLSTDPKWEAVGNKQRFDNADLYAYNNFGYSKTSFAGGSAGEIGGRFVSCDPPEDEFKACFGDNIGKLSFNDHLVARGRFFAKEFSIDSTFALGWFNSKEQGWPIKNFVGVYFDSLSDVGRIVQPLHGTASGTNTREGKWVPFEPAVQYQWTLEYDPAAAEGRGAITFTIGDQTVTTPLAEGAKSIGASFDRFGFFNMQWANSKWCEIYLDDISYTSGKP